tara:strand:+ start:3533 stop:4543 length:1011 start_codon:yes stop_codon:yes gene_type:complete
MSKLTNCLLNKDQTCVPVWFMRQAGRYLPEFRKIRQQNKDFIKLCLDSDLSSEITLQPIKRFNLDAAIIFSDILITPFALGQDVNFIKDEGPILSSFKLESFIKNNEENFTNKLKPVYAAITKTRNKLDKEKSLIGFIGAPWTLIIYMFGLKKEKNKLDLIKLKKKEKEIKHTIDILINYLCVHIKHQARAGADIIQIFDSWAGLIPEDKLFEYCYEPNKKIVDFCKINNIPVICFPRNIKKNYVNFAQIVNPSCLSLDYEIEPNWAKDNLTNYCLQGGINPSLLFEDDEVIFKEVDKYLNIFKGHPYIFNLGHGLLPETNPDTLQKVVERVKNFK